MKRAKDLLVVTVATDETDGFVRWRDSVERHNLDYHVIGMGEGWFSVLSASKHLLISCQSKQRPKWPSLKTLDRMERR